MIESVLAKTKDLRDDDAISELRKVLEARSTEQPPAARSETARATTPRPAESQSPSKAKSGESLTGYCLSGTSRRFHLKFVREVFRSSGFVPVGHRVDELM